MTQTNECPVCSASRFGILVTSEELSRECEQRQQFIKERLSHEVSAAQLKDLTEFFHDAAAEILICEDCSLLIRREVSERTAESYSEEEYDAAAIEAVYPQYLEAFRAKEAQYRRLLPEGAAVLEIGSHYGAFLETATEWGWKAEGVDIGRTTSRFAQSRGQRVHQCELQECAFAERSFDGVFLWNCFEQLDDPKPLLAEIGRVLKDGGLLAVRVPNGRLYATYRSTDPKDTKVHDELSEAMAYNNLLGFPYLYGHREETLDRLVTPFGFRFEQGFNSLLITLPLPDPEPWVEQEEGETNAEICSVAKRVRQRTGDLLAAPWIELCYRRA